MVNDHIYLNRTVKLARAGIAEGHGPFAALVVKGDNIIAETMNSVVIENDPTAHAEILAIREASKLLGSHDLSGCTLYTSCEPCPMCLGAIYWSGIRKVVYALDRNDAGAAGFSDDFIYRQISLAPGERSIEFVKLPDDESSQIFRAWIDFDDRKPY